MAKLTLAQQMDNLPDVPFDVYWLEFQEDGPVMVRGKCVAKEKSRCVVNWPSGETEKLKPTLVGLNRQDAYSQAAEELLSWGISAFMGAKDENGEKRVMRHHMQLVEIIKLATAHRAQKRRESRARDEIDKTVYGTESAEK